MLRSRLLIVSAPSLPTPQLARLSTVAVAKCSRRYEPIISASLATTKSPRRHLFQIPLAMGAKVLALITIKKLAIMGILSPLIMTIYNNSRLKMKQTEYRFTLFCAVCAFL